MTVISIVTLSALQDEIPVIRAEALQDMRRANRLRLTADGRVIKRSLSLEIGVSDIN